MSLKNHSMGRDQYEDNEMCFSSIFILLHFLRVKDDLNLLVRFVFKFTHMFNAHSAVKSSFHCLLISAKTQRTPDIVPNLFFCCQFVSYWHQDLQLGKPIFRLFRLLLY